MNVVRCTFETCSLMEPVPRALPIFMSIMAPEG